MSKRILMILKGASSIKISAINIHLNKARLTSIFITNEISKQKASSFTKSSILISIFQNKTNQLFEFHYYLFLNLNNKDCCCAAMCCCAV